MKNNKKISFKKVVGALTLFSFVFPSLLMNAAEKDEADMHSADNRSNAQPTKNFRQKHQKEQEQKKRQALLTSSSDTTQKSSLLSTKASETAGRDRAHTAGPALKNQKNNDVSTRSRSQANLQSPKQPAASSKKQGLMSKIWKGFKSGAKKVGSLAKKGAKKAWSGAKKAGSWAKKGLVKGAKKTWSGAKKAGSFIKKQTVKGYNKTAKFVKSDEFKKMASDAQDTVMNSQIGRRVTSAAQELAAKLAEKKLSDFTRKTENIIVDAADKVGVTMYKKDENGNFINKKGQLVNENGDFLDSEGRVLNDRMIGAFKAKGWSLAANGLFVNEKKDFINVNYQPVNKNGTLLDPQGQAYYTDELKFMKENGFTTNTKGQIVDNEGTVLDRTLIAENLNKLRQSDVPEASDIEDEQEGEAYEDVSNEEEEEEAAEAEEAEEEEEAEK